MSRADRMCLLPAEGVELRGFELALVVVGLVGSHQNRGLCRPKEVGRFQVRRCQACDRVDHQDDDIGLADGQSCLLLDLLFDRVAGTNLQAAGIDHDEAATVPVGVAVDTVACRPGSIFDDGGPVADDSIEQRALADVRTADHGNDGEWVHPRIMDDRAATPALEGNWSTRAYESGVRRP